MHDEIVVVDCSTGDVTRSKLTKTALAERERDARAEAKRTAAAEAAAEEMAAARERLRELHEKGWDNLTADERGELGQHTLRLLAQ